MDSPVHPESVQVSLVVLNHALAGGCQEQHNSLPRLGPHVGDDWTTSLMRPDSFLSNVSEGAENALPSKALHDEILIID
jgi:hypothetical protein